MPEIKKAQAREILSSGSTPTIEVKVTLKSGATGTASVPFGASAGIHEAYTLIDNDRKRFAGKGMLKAISNVNRKISPKLVGLDISGQREIDDRMIGLDGTENKSNLGGNAILCVSLAAARACSNEKKIPLYRHIRETFNLEISDWLLPNPMMVVIEGGKHADNSTDFQEYCVVPMSGISCKENIRMGIETYFALKYILKKKGYGVNVGNEGAFAPDGIETNELPLSLIEEAIEKAGYATKKDIGLSLDLASSEFFENGLYNLTRENRKLTSPQLTDYLSHLSKKYPFLMAIEDGLHQDDWDNWTELTRLLGKEVLIIGDDLTVTNIKRLERAVKIKAINSVIIKLNQIGTLSECVDSCMFAKKNGLTSIVSHRGGGETNDTTMVDLAAAVNSSFIKIGPSRGERVCKYNRLMEIEEELGKDARPVGKDFKK